jgi:hypothetical protein
MKVDMKRKCEGEIVPNIENRLLKKARKVLTSDKKIQLGTVLIC